MQISVVGAWHLGSVATAGWLACGHTVRVWDPDADLAQRVVAGSLAVAEPDLAAVLDAGRADGRLFAESSLPAALAGAECVHVAYDTRVDATGRVADPRLDDCVTAGAAYAPDQALVLVSSQLRLGTCARWRALLDAMAPAQRLVYFPENLRLGRALEDFMSPARTVIGLDTPATLASVAPLLEPIGGDRYVVDLATAELIKHATNAYLATCITFANELGWIARDAGADIGAVVDALRADERVSDSAPLRPGTAFSGATLQRDLRALGDSGAELGRGALFDAVLAANDKHALFTIDLLRERLSPAQSRICAIGLTYKPGTSTLRDSLPLRIIGELLAEGAHVTAWDPAADDPQDLGGCFERVADLGEAVKGADAVVVLTALRELAEVDWSALEPAARVIVDGCGALVPETLTDADWEYLGILAGTRA